MIWEFTSKGGPGSAPPAGLLFPHYSSLVALTLAALASPGGLDKHMWLGYTPRVSDSCMISPLTSSCRCLGTTLKHHFNPVTFTLPLRCSVLPPPPFAHLGCALCSISWPWGPPFILSSERPCPNIRANVVFSFPGPQCHRPWFCFPLRLLSFSEIAFVWLSQE